MITEGLVGVAIDWIVVAITTDDVEKLIQSVKIASGYFKDIVGNLSKSRK